LPRLSLSTCTLSMHCSSVRHGPTALVNVVGRVQQVSKTREPFLDLSVPLPAECYPDKRRGKGGSRNHTSAATVVQVRTISSPASINAHGTDRAAALQCQHANPNHVIPRKSMSGGVAYQKRKNEPKPLSSKVPHSIRLLFSVCRPPNRRSSPLLPVNLPTTLRVGFVTPKATQATGQVRARQEATRGEDSSGQGHA
jgi:hypothetical protein